MKITELTGLITAIAFLMTAYGTWKNGRKVAAVHSDVIQVKREVTTMNSLSIANLADNAEKRRAEKIPPRLRTVDEQAHVDTPLSIGQTDVVGVPATADTSGEKV